MPSCKIYGCRKINATHLLEIHCCYFMCAVYVLAIAKFFLSRRVSSGRLCPTEKLSSGFATGCSIKPLGRFTFEWSEIIGQRRKFRTCIQASSQIYCTVENIKHPKVDVQSGHGSTAPVRIWEQATNAGPNTKQELSYRKQIARQLRTQYVKSIYVWLPITLKSRSRVTQGHWKRNHWINHTRLTISPVI